MIRNAQLRVSPGHPPRRTRLFEADSGAGQARRRRPGNFDQRGIAKCGSRIGGCAGTVPGYFGFSGRNGRKMRNLVDLCSCVPSSSTPRVHEAQILAGHILTGIVGNVLLSERRPKFSGRLMTRSR
jgi:hypothetical protein